MKIASEILALRVRPAAVTVHDLPGRWAIPLANGFSGHGLNLAPAIGVMLARQITGERAHIDTDVNAAVFAIDRDPISLGSKSVLAWHTRGSGYTEPHPAGMPERIHDCKPLPRRQLCPPRR